MDLQTASQAIARIASNVRHVIKGKDTVIRQTIACWLAGGHVLLEDVPGTGKTLLARTLAASIGVKATRVQFTPDLIPSDIVGSSIWSKEEGKFLFLKGPLFTKLLLADEINRATPRTQAALLEAMAEGQITVENTTYKLPDGIFVIATQNPVEQHGTFPLPEAQLDRFMMRLSLGYPQPKDEVEVVRSQLLSNPLAQISAVISEQDFLAIQALTKTVQVSEACIQYAISLCHATRNHQSLKLGASSRAALSLVRIAQAFAVIDGVTFVKPDHLKYVAEGVLGHRIAITAKSRMDGISSEHIVSQIIQSVPVPTQ